VTIMGSKKRNSKKLKHIKKDKNTISKRKGIILIAISLVILSGVLGFTFMYDENISDPNVKPVDVVENQEPVELTDEEKKAIFEKLREQENMSNLFKENRCEPGTTMVDGECKPIMIETPYK